MDVKEQRIICKVCLTQYAKYICPRCNLAYCSLACYKRHSADCTEAFYRDQAVSQLQSTHADNENKRRLLAVLQRAQEQRVEDEALLQAAVRQDEDFAGDADTGSDSEGSDGDSQTDGDTHSSDSEHEDSNDQGSASSDHDSNDADTQGQRPHAGTNGVQGHREGAGASVSGRGHSTEGVSQQRQRGRQRGLLSRRTLAKLYKKLQAVDLNDHDPTSLINETDLTPKEWEAFQRAVAAGRLAHLVPAWQPWWLSAEARTLQLSGTGQSLVQVTTQPPTPTTTTVRQQSAAQHSNGNSPQQQPSTSTGSGDDAAGYSAQSSGGARRAESQATNGGVSGAQQGHTRRQRGQGDAVPQSSLPPPSDKPLVTISQLTRVKPSPHLQWQVMELLYAYCFVQRRYNGDAADPANLPDAASLVLNLSPVLATHIPAPAPKVAGNSGSQGSTSAGGVGTVVASAGGGADSGSSARPAAAPAAAALPANAPCVSVRDVVARCLGVACAPPVGDMTNRPMALGVLGDVVSVLEAGHACTLLAFTDLQRLLSLAAALRSRTGADSGMDRHNKAQKTDSTRVLRRAAAAAAAKVWFTMCWLNDAEHGRGSEGGLTEQLAVAITPELHALLQMQQRPGTEPVLPERH